MNNFHGKISYPMQNALYLFINVKGVLIRKKLGNSLQSFNKDFSALFQPLYACLLEGYP